MEEVLRWDLAVVAAREAWQVIVTVLAMWPHTYWVSAVPQLVNDGRIPLIVVVPHTPFHVVAVAQTPSAAVVGKHAPLEVGHTPRAEVLGQATSYVAR